jgi:hypothetical protein
MIRLLAVLIVFASVASAENVTVNGKYVPHLYVKTLVLENAAPSCDNPQYDQYDTNHDSRLDSNCVGLKYNPCNYSESITFAYAHAAYTGQCTGSPICNDDLVVSPADCPQ